MQSTSDIAITDGEKVLFEELYAFLTAAGEGRDHTPSPGSAHIDAVVTVLNRWPSDRRWPLIDLARLIAAYCGHGLSSYSRAKFVGALCTAADWAGPWENPTPQRNTIVGLVLRAAANALIGASASEAADILSVVDAAPYVALNKASRGAYAAMLVKYVSARPDVFVRRLIIMQLLYHWANVAHRRLFAIQAPVPYQQYTSARTVEKTRRCRRPCARSGGDLSGTCVTRERCASRQNIWSTTIAH